VGGVVVVWSTGRGFGGGGAGRAYLPVRMSGYAHGWMAAHSWRQVRLRSPTLLVMKENECDVVITSDRPDAGTSRPVAADVSGEAGRIRSFNGARESTGWLGIKGLVGTVCLGYGVHLCHRDSRGDGRRDRGRDCRYSRPADQGRNTSGFRHLYCAERRMR
jgi:hypothetical protein